MYCIKYYEFINFVSCLAVKSIYRSTNKNHSFQPLPPPQKKHNHIYKRTSFILSAFKTKTSSLLFGIPYNLLHKDFAPKLKYSIMDASFSVYILPFLYYIENSYQTLTINTKAILIYLPGRQNCSNGIILCISN